MSALADGKVYMDTVQINYLHVIVAALAPMVIGALWYSPMLFSKPWAAAVGKKIEDMRANGSMGYAGSMIAALVLSFVMAHFLAYVGAITVADGLKTAFWAWLGFTATATLSDTLFAGRSFNLYVINNGYQLVSFLAVATILTAWK